MSPSLPSPTRNDQIYRETKGLAAIIIPFLLAAFYILYLRPTETGELFAWAIKPSMTARMLGAAYMGGVYFFARALRANRWHHIQLGFLPVTAFATAMGIATILHWDRFNHQHISFYTWTLLYFTTPFLVLGTWLRNKRTDPGTPDPQDLIFTRPVRVALGAVGSLTALISLLLFLFPAGMINVWPWTLTPLTARVVGGMFALPGVLELYMAVDGRWSSARIMLESQTFSIAFIVLAVFLSWTDFDPARGSTWLFLGGMIFLLITLPLLSLTMHRLKKIAPA